MFDSKARLQITKRRILHILLKIVFIFGLVLKSFHQFRPCLCRLFDMICGVRLSPDVYWKSLFSREMLEGVVDSILFDWNKTTKPAGELYLIYIFMRDMKYFLKMLSVFLQPTLQLLAFFSILLKFLCFY